MSTPDIPNENHEMGGVGTLVYRDNDLDHPPIEGSWHEVEIRKSDRGLVVDALQVDTSQDDAAPRDVVAERDGYSYEQFRNFMDLRGIAETEGPLRAASELAGVSVRAVEDARGERYRGYVPDFEALRERFDFVREQTGYAPTLEQFNGVEFDHDTMAQKEIEGVVLVSDDPPTHTHDVLAHARVRLALTEDVNGDIGARTLELRNAVQRHEPGSPGHKRTSADLTRHLDYIDKTINARPIVGIGTLIERTVAGDPEGRSMLTKTLKKLTGITDNDAIENSIRGIETRVSDLSRLADSLSQSQNMSENEGSTDPSRGTRVAAAFGHAVGARASRSRHGAPRRSGQERRLDPHNRKPQP